MPTVQGKPHIKSSCRTKPPGPGELPSHFWQLLPRQGGWDAARPAVQEPNVPVLDPQVPRTASPREHTPVPTAQRIARPSEKRWWETPSRPVCLARFKPVAISPLAKTIHEAARQNRTEHKKGKTIGSLGVKEEKKGKKCQHELQSFQVLQ